MKLCFKNHISSFYVLRFLHYDMMITNLVLIYVNYLLYVSCIVYIVKWSHHSVANRIKPIYGHQATCFHKQDVLVFGGKICDVFSNHIYLLDMQAKVIGSWLYS